MANVPAGQEPYGGVATIVIDEYDDEGLPALTRLQTKVAHLVGLLRENQFVVDDRDLVGDRQSPTVRRALGENWLSDGGRLLVYWAGHGRVYGNGLWLCCRDTVGRPTTANALSARELGQLIARWGIGEVVLVVDACHAGGGAEEIGRAFDEASQTTRLEGGRRLSLAVISSASRGELAQEAVFASAFCEVLAEGPPEDASHSWWTEHDRYIFPQELVEAIDVRLRRNGSRQRPDHHMVGRVNRFFPNPGYVAYSPEGEVEAKRRRAVWLPTDVRQHFMMKFRGIDSAEESGWYFTGRQQPLRQVVSWLRAEQSDMLVVTGPPGCGKSAVLGHLAVLSDERYRAEAGKAGALRAVTDHTDPGIGAITAGVHAKNKTMRDCVTELSDALGVPAPLAGWASASQLITALADRAGSEREPITLLVDALDEADPRDVYVIARELLSGLAALPHVRVIVGTRCDRAQPELQVNGAGEGRLLRALGTHKQVIQLGDDPDGLDAVADYVHHRLLDVEGSPYRGMDEQARAAALAVAERSEGVFLFGRLLARRLGGSRTVLNLASAEAKQMLSGGMIDAFADELARFGENQRRARDLMTPLAWAEGVGLPRRDVWLTMANALAVDPNSRYDDSDLAWALDNAGVYLVEAGEDGQTVYRLYHQAFDDYLQATYLTHSVDEAAVHSRITTALLALAGPKGQRDWRNVNPYLHRHLATHAARAARIDDLLIDDDYLLHADLGRLAPLADHATSEPGQNRARLLQLTPEAIRADPETRRALFSVTEALEGLGHNYRADPRRSPYCGDRASATPQVERVILAGHTDEVTGVCASTHDGRTLLVSVSDDNTVRIWDPPTGQELHVLESHTRSIDGVCAFTHNQQAFLATAGYDAVHIWDPATGQHLDALTGHAGEVHSVTAFTSDGKTLLATAGSDGTVRICDPDTGDQLSAIKCYERDCTTVCVVQTEQERTLIATSGKDAIGFSTRLKIWDPVTGNEIHVLQEGRSMTVDRICVFSHNCRPLLAIAAKRDTVQIWDPAAGRLERTIEAPGTIRDLRVFDQNGRSRLATYGGHDDNEVRIWDPTNGEEIHVLQGHTEPVRDMCAVFLPDRTVLATSGGSGDSTVRIWDPATGEELHVLQGRSSSWLGSSLDGAATSSMCAFRHHGRTLLATINDGTVKVSDPDTGKRLPTLDPPENVIDLGVVTLGDQDLLAAASRSTLTIWDPTDGPTYILEDDDLKISAVLAFASGGQTLLAIAGDSGDGTVRIWNPATGQQLHRLQHHTGRAKQVRALTSGERSLLATLGQEDSTVRIWDHTGQQLHVIQGHTGQWSPSDIEAICTFTHHGRALLATASNSDVRIWDPITGQHQRTIEIDGPVGELHALTSKELPLLATVFDEATQVWDPATGQRLQRMTTNNSIRNAFAATLEGRGLLVTSDGYSDETIVRIWDPASGEQLHTIDSHNDEITGACAFSHDGRDLVATASCDGTVRIWDLVTGEQQNVFTGHRSTLPGGVKGMCLLTLGDRSWLATAGEDRTVRIWDPIANKQSGLRRHIGSVTVHALKVEQRNRLVTTGDDGKVRIWDPTTGQELQVLEGHTSPARLPETFMLDGVSLLAAGSYDGAVRIWDTATGQELRALEGDGVLLGLCVFSVADRTLLASANDGSSGPRIWDPTTGELLQAMEGHNTVLRMCTLPMGNQTLLATGGATDGDYSVRIWDPSIGEQLHVMHGGDWVGGLWEFSLSGRTLLASADAGIANDIYSVRIWDPSTGEQLHVLQGHVGLVTQMCAFTMNGQTLLATASADGTVQIWDPDSGQQIQVLQGHTDSVDDMVVISRSGQTLLATAGNDRTVRIWHPTAPNCLLTIPVHHPATSVEWVEPNLAVGLAAGFLTIRLNEFV